MRTCIAAIVIPAVLATAVAIYVLDSGEEAAATIRVGILHSLTGTMAISEKSVVDATLLAIEEINREGGVLGRLIEPIVLDGKSDWPTFASAAERLIAAEQVAVVFGCWTSASRKTVKPVFERHDHLLFYPVQYEGLEQSANIVYTGATPNQQIIPAVTWCFDNLGRTFFLVGSDYVFPRTANAIIRHRVEALGGEIVGEEYAPLGDSDFRSAVQAIQRSKPDVILNTINGDSNVAFFRELRLAGITPDRTPTLSFSIAENELRVLGAEGVVGDYACWNYFQSVATEENGAFIASFRREYGADRVVDDPMEAAYLGVHIWAQGVRDAGTADVVQVRQAIPGQSYDAPQGLVHIDGDNRHTWKRVRVGKIREDGQFDVVWDSGKAVRPMPFPAYRSRAEWDRFLQDLYRGWGGSWANSGKG
ncbi:MAG: urea ABC transporter substrate-binding protein [Lentisphaerae bacterium]|jgi:urea transport system substrate-binding protein|nr:urea ABC transporter substrate-binding protein [Lentisphaerota bacterium]MBT4822691.1 urea ABC transporter substrate-binding protein [Lentisphaerota bacterium]MBT5604446.1 urea ABC transporter substrate-binding protein [Lentisphaerota bacterium]MBT7058203.1 urea ABC transporter substrate-binding protein [Lentisphaerota bacterium]MBT7847413.1 urea ABC transporter substrate-binding protein [Lentisphaerota bacterium]